MPEDSFPGDLSKFITLCLEPLEGVIDERDERKYNWTARKTRKRAFRTAAYRMKAADLACNLMTYSKLALPDRDRENDLQIDKARQSLVARWRQLRADLIRTPAGDVAQLTQKKALVKSRQFPYTPISMEEALRCIAQDEMFLDAHPVRGGRKPPIGRSTGGQS
jgi:hypothetical protein